MSGTTSSGRDQCHLCCRFILLPIFPVAQRRNATTTSLAAQKPDHSLPHLTFRIVPHKWLEPQLQIQRDRRQPIGLRIKTSFSTSCLPGHREHTDNQRPRQALPTPIQIRRNPTHPTTLRNVNTYLQRSRRHQPPVCRDHQRRLARPATEQLTLSTCRIPPLGLKRAAQERRQSSSLLHLSAPDYQRCSQNRHCRNTKERRPPHRDVDRHSKRIGFL